MGRIGILATLVLLAGVAAQANPYIALLDAGGLLYGAPGQTVGWGFTIHPDDSEWVLITAVTLQENGPLGGPVGTAITSCFDPGAPVTCNGFLLDVGGPSPFIAVPSIADGGTDWTVPFSSSGDGLAAYAIDPATPSSAFEGGVNTLFLITYDLYPGDPLTCGGCSPDFSGLTLHLQNGSDPLFAIQVVPEPGTTSLLGLGVAALLYAARRRKARPGC
jgi:hypothetical protein